MTRNRIDKAHVTKTHLPAPEPAGTRPAGRWEYPSLDQPTLLTVDQLGRALRLMRRLRTDLRGIDSMVLPDELNAELEAVDVAMRRVLLMARHGGHYPAVDREDCHTVSEALDDGQNLDDARY